MVAISATSSATQSLQQSLLQGKVAQAKRDAERAESQAQDLRQQADRAEEEAQSSRANYRQVREQSASAQSATYDSPRQNQASEVPLKTQDFLVRMYTAAADKFASSGNPLKTDSSSSPVKNGLGQSTGRIVNIHT